LTFEKDFLRIFLVRRLEKNVEKAELKIDGKFLREEAGNSKKMGNVIFRSTGR